MALWRGQLYALKELNEEGPVRKLSLSELAHMCVACRSFRLRWLKQRRAMTRAALAAMLWEVAYNMLTG